MNPPEWNVHLGWCDDVWVTDFKALSPPPDVVEANSDGIDVDACQRVLIEDSYFSVSSTAREYKTARAGLRRPHRRRCVSR